MIEFKDVARAATEEKNRNAEAALATIVRIRGSSPRHNGARMFVRQDGQILGTIGGGTMEYRVIEDAIASLSSGQPQYLNYVFDASGRPGSVGLCGGSVDVHIAVKVGEFAEVSRLAVEALEQGESVVLASIVLEGDTPPTREQTYLLVWQDGRTQGSLGSSFLDDRAVEAALEALKEGSSRFVTVSLEEEDGDPFPIGIHLDVLEPNQTLLIIGAGHVAQPLAAMGDMLGFRVCVVDDREEWANRERFPSAAEIAVIDYEPTHEILAPIPFPMNQSTYMVVTTWGYDLPAMEQALEQNPAYIGLVASPTKARVLFKRLQEAGFSDEDIQKIKAPVGLDIGAESPAELALSILSEILVDMREKSGKPLREVRGAIIDSLFASTSRNHRELSRVSLDQ